jgi:hypothetical protein
MYAKWNIRTTDYILITIFFGLLFWSLLNNVFYLRFDKDKGIVFKLFYFRKIDLNNVRKATFEDGLSKYDFLLGRTYIIKLRQKKGNYIILPFAKKSNYLIFRKLIEENSKLKITDENHYVNRRKRRFKTSN